MNRVGPVIITMAMLAAGYSAYQGKSKVSDLKEKVLNIDSTRYKNACKRLDKELLNKPSSLEDHTHNYSVEINFWRNEYKAAKDSIEALKLDGLAKKAYIEGAQLVKDRFKAAAKLSCK